MNGWISASSLSFPIPTGQEKPLKRTIILRPLRRPINKRHPSGDLAQIVPDRPCLIRFSSFCIVRMGVRVRDERQSESEQCQKRPLGVMWSWKLEEGEDRVDERRDEDGEGEGERAEEA